MSKKNAPGSGNASQQTSVTEGRRPPLKAAPEPQALGNADLGRVRWLETTRDDARADMLRSRTVAAAPEVEESLRRIGRAAKAAGREAIETLVSEFLAERRSARGESRVVFVAGLEHLYGYPIPETGSLCVTQDILREPRELDLTLCRQLFALLDSSVDGETNESTAERLLSPSIIHVSMEMMPYARRGGVADVVHGLPGALTALGHNVAVFIPYYGNMSDELLGIESAGLSIEVMGESLDVRRSSHQGVQVYLLGHDRFGERPYDGDELATAVLFCQAVPVAIKALRMRPDVIHCHDWQTGLLPGYLKQSSDPHFAGTRVLFTVHNLGYRGLFPNDRYWVTGLASDMHGLYRDGDTDFSLLVGGIRSAGKGMVNTVSPNYAREIRETELGWGLQGTLKEVEIFGLLNGVDHDVYSPETDPHLRRNYTVTDAPAARATNKADLQSVRVAILGDDAVASHMPEILPGCNLEHDPSAFVIGMIARIAEQKGLEVMVGALRALLDEGHQLQFLFNGQPARGGDFYCRDIIRMLFPLVNAYPNRILIRFSHEFDHALGQKMYAGCDVLVSTPSYEPCGLEPMKCCRYGCVPIVRMTGGLADQVSEYDPTENPTGNGFVFHEFEPQELAGALRRAMTLYRDQPEDWRDLVRHCMSLDFSWEESARRYLNWYYRVSR